MATHRSLILTNIDRLSGGLHGTIKFNGIRVGRQSLIYVQTWTRQLFKMTLKPLHSLYIHKKIMKFASYVPYPILNAMYYL